MYFWRDKKLAHDLHKGIVTEKQQVGYLIAISILASAIFSILSLNTMETIEITYFDYINQAIVLVSAVLPIIVVFNINKSGDGKEFIVRFMCLSFPIAIKSNVISIIPFIIDPFLFPQSADFNLDELKDIDYKHLSKVGFASGIMVLAYSLWRYIICFKIASGQKEYGK